MAEEKLVSIIAPCYNGEKHLKPFLESVLAQSYRHFELIFVNDGSTDATETLALEYGERLEQRGARFIYIYQKNAGQAAAVNCGLQVFSGEYLMWIDSDDIMLPAHIAEKVSFLESHPEYGFVLAQGEQVNENDLDTRVGILKREPPEGKDDLFADLLHERNVVFGPGTIMVRREALETAIPTKTIFPSREGQNWQLMLPIAYMYPCGYLEKVLFKRVVRKNSHSRQHRDYSAWIERYNGFQELQLHTLAGIPMMSEQEKREWEAFIKIRFARKRLERAHRFIKREDARSIKAELACFGYQCNWRDSFLVFWMKGIYRKVRLRLFRR